MSDSDSDSSSDEDYVPEGEVASSDAPSGSDDEDRHDNSTAGTDRTKNDDKDSEVEEKSKDKRLKQLWDSFKQSTKTVVKPQTKTELVNVTKTYDFAGEEVKVTEAVPADSSKAAEQGIAKNDASTKPADNQEAKKTNVKRSSSGLGSILQQIQKKPKISTLEKSKLDWNLFKKNEGIEEELTLHNKDGYLEKQAFLQRTDVRQFEKEREIRLKNFKRLT